MRKKTMKGPLMLTQNERIGRKEILVELLSTKYRGKYGVCLELCVIRTCRPANRKAHSFPRSLLASSSTTAIKVITTYTSL